MYPRSQPDITDNTINTIHANLVQHTRARGAALLEEQRILAEQRARWDREEIRLLFTQANNRLALYAPIMLDGHPEEWMRLQESLHVLQHELINEVNQRTDDLPIKTARQLANTINTVTDLNSGPNERKHAIHQFQRTARNSSLSFATKKNINLAVNVVTSALLLVSMSAALCVLLLAACTSPSPVFLAMYIVGRIGVPLSTPFLLNAVWKSVDNTMEPWLANPDEHRGETVSNNLNALFHPSNRLPQPRTTSPIYPSAPPSEPEDNQAQHAYSF